MHTDRTDTIDRPGCAAAGPRTREVKAGDLTAGMILRFIDGESLTVSRVCPDEDGTVLVTFDGIDGEAPYNVEETVTVVGWDGAVAPLAEPDYWLSLAADLRAAADRVASLAGTPAPEVSATLSLYVGLYVEEGHKERQPVVDAIAAAFDGTAAADGRMGSIWECQADAKVGGLHVTASTRIPAPEDAELVALRARVAELEAERAEDGAR